MNKSIGENVADAKNKLENSRKPETKDMSVQLETSNDVGVQSNNFIVPEEESSFKYVNFSHIERVKKDNISSNDYDPNQVNFHQIQHKLIGN